MTHEQVAAVAGALAILVFLAFAVLLWRLHTQVRRLGAEVTALRSRAAPLGPHPESAGEWSRQARPPVAEEGRVGGDSKRRQRAERRRESPAGPDRRPDATASTVSAAGSTAEPVPLITGLRADTGGDGVEPSAARIASVTLGPTLIKIAAFSHGVRRALGDEQRMRVSYAVRKELRRQRKLRRRRRRSTMATEGGRP